MSTTDESTLVCCFKLSHRDVKSQRRRRKKRPYSSPLILFLNGSYLLKFFKSTNRTSSNILNDRCGFIVWASLKWIASSCNRVPACWVFASSLNPEDVLNRSRQPCSRSSGTLSTSNGGEWKESENSWCKMMCSESLVNCMGGKRFLLKSGYIFRLVGVIAG